MKKHLLEIIQTGQTTFSALLHPLNAKNETMNGYRFAGGKVQSGNKIIELTITETPFVNFIKKHADHLKIFLSKSQQPRLERRGL